MEISLLSSSVFAVASFRVDLVFLFGRRAVAGLLGTSHTSLNTKVVDKSLMLVALSALFVRMLSFRSAHASLLVR